MMTTGAESPLDALDRESVIRPVRQLLGDEAAELIDWRHESLAYTVRNPVAGGVYRVTGHARTHGAVQPWSLILKVSHFPTGRAWPDGRVAPEGWGTDATHSQYWQREALAYQSGLLDDLSGALVAPRCFGVDVRGGETIRLWLEEIHETEQRPWPLARYGVVARHLGRFNGAYLAGRPLPTAPWLNRGFLRAWTQDPARVTLTDTITRAETWTHPLVREAFPIPVADRLLRLHMQRESLLTTLERLPQTLCHLDAFPGNLLARTDAHAPDGQQTVALDWAFVGVAAVGEEVGHLIAWSLMLDAVADDDAEDLRAVVLTGYTQGLREAGWSVSAVECTRAVALGASVSAAMRWAFGAAGRVVRLAVDEPARVAIEQTTGRSVNEEMARRARLVYFLLNWVDETDALRATP